MERQSMTLKFDLRLVCVVLLLVIALMLAMWRPWNNTPSTAQRKITITGTATVSAEPDEYLFSPYYERATNDEIATLATELVPKLKELGVADKDIKTSASNYDNYYYPVDISSPVRKDQTTLGLQVVVRKKDIVQKVQDYLLSTSPKGAISPYATFSTQKQKDLQDQARSKATEDARRKADQTASGLKAKIGKVLEVNDGGGYGGITPLSAPSVAEDSAVKSSLPVQTGENELQYSVSVVFELK